MNQKPGNQMLIWAAALCCALLPINRLGAQASVNTRASVPLAAKPAPATRTVPVLARSYLLRPGDVLEISVLGHDDFKQTTTISPDGTINYPGVGTATAAGLTREQLTRVLAHGLVRQVLRPQVNINVQQTHPRQISMTGQGVHAPGVYDWRPGMTVLDAIAAAGGVAQAPEQTDALLIPSATREADPINLVKLIEQGDQSQNADLQPGDIILMSPRDPAKAFVQVIGQVGRPGPAIVPSGGATLQSVLTQAGGVLRSAALTQVQVVHNGQTRTLNLHNTLFDVNDPAAQMRLDAGDVVNVPLNDNRIQFYGEINQPGEMIIPDGQPLTLTRAIAMRGGPTRESDQKAIGIVRTNAAGKQEAYAVNEDDLLRARNKGQDIVLQPGDKIVVPRRRQATTPLGALSTAVGTLFGIRALGGFLH